jgi:hypothetical protein
MGVPTSEVGYTSATTGRETTKSIRDMWWHWKTTTIRGNTGVNECNEDSKESLHRSDQEQEYTASVKLTFKRQSADHFI